MKLKESHEIRNNIYGKIIKRFNYIINKRKDNTYDFLGIKRFVIQIIST